VAIHLANPEAFSPQSPDSLGSVRKGTFPESFLEAVTLFEIPVRTDFLAFEDFSGDGSKDLLFAAKDGNTMYISAGDGKGGFRAPRPIQLAGRITALLTANLQPGQLGADVIVGLQKGSASALAVYHFGRDHAGELRREHTVPGPVSSLAIANFDTALYPDVLIVAGQRLMLLHGEPTGGGRMESIGLPFAVDSAVAGHFNRALSGMQIAALRSDGSVAVLSRDKAHTLLPSRGVRVPIRPMAEQPLASSWRWRRSIGATIQRPGSVGSQSRGRARLLAARISGLPSDDVIVFDDERTELRIWNLENGPETGGQEGALTLSAAQPFVAVTPMRLNVMGAPGLVMLTEHSLAPVVLTQVPVVTYHVTATPDSQSGICTTPSGNPLTSTCTTLRAAVIAANANPGHDAIVFDVNGTITLSVSGLDDNAQAGDLDITDLLTIVGNGPANTIIQGGASSGTGIDKVFSFNPLGQQAGFAVSVSGLTIQFGNNQGTGLTDGNNEGGAFDFDASILDGAGSLSLANCNILQNQTVNGDGGGIALFDGGTVSITNTVISGNQAGMQNPGTSWWGYYGGGIYITGGGFNYYESITITNSTISNNTASTAGQALPAQVGGGLYADIPNVSIQGSTVSGNRASSEGGGLYGYTFIVSGGSIISGNIAGGNGGGMFGASSVTGSALTGNSAGYWGGALWSDGPSALLVNSRIVGNTAGQSSSIVDADTSRGGAVTAINNWWGSNNSPAGFVNPSVVSYSPWLVMTFSASPTAVNAGSTAALTASITTNSNNSSGFRAPDGTPVNFSATLGTVNPSSLALASGAATATYTAGSAPGTASVSATIDNQTLPAALNVVLPPPPTLTSVSPTSGSQGASVPVTLAGTNFITGATVATNNPGITVSGVTVVSTTQITATLAIDASAAPGAANVTVTTIGGTSNATAFTVIAKETISTPAVPAGPATGVSGTLYQYTASGASSSLGHVIQYSFDWGDGSHSGWTPNGFSSSFHAWNAPGTYTVTVQARCSGDNSVLSSVSPGLTVTIAGESVSMPSTPNGPATAVTGTAVTYSTGGATSSLGHTVQYRFLWGDGSNSPWLAAGTISASQTWLSPGTYSVIVQARCTIDTQVISQTSTALTVTVSGGETISTPTTPAGPSNGAVSSSYTYSMGGATSSLGNSVQYLFDWGDGTTSGWLTVGVTTASHQWTAAGSYSVKAYAASSASLLIQSSPSAGLAVTIQ
jgi:hypothetical protein